MPRMLASLLSDLMDSEADIVLAALVADGGDLDDAIAASSPDVVVLGRTDAAAAPVYDPLLLGHPSLRLLLIDAPGQRGWIYELAPQLVALAEMTPAALLMAIRARPAPAGALRSGA